MAPPPRRFRRGPVLETLNLFMARQRLRVIVGVFVLLGVQAGCAGVRSRETRFLNAIEERWERFDSSRALSGSSGTALQRHGLVEAAANDPATAARTLEARLAKHADPEGTLALAELSYQAGLQQQSKAPSASLAWYRDAAQLAALSLSDSTNPQPEVAVRIHNNALARLIRVSQSEAERTGTTWRVALGNAGLALGTTAEYLDPKRIADLRVASDFSVSGMQHVYARDGFGVPLVAHRLAVGANDQEPGDRYLPRELFTGATAVVVPSGEMLGGTWRNNPATLLLFDPFEGQSFHCGKRVVNLAEDRTTPLAAQLGRTSFATLEWMGLLEPSFRRGGRESGLYMLRPYERGKIPVVLVHGLVSSPRAWVQTINELRNTPALASRYQFWVFLYPTGMPIPTSAVSLRHALVGAREALDPAHSDEALDRLVLVGHSMGGLLSKMMAQDTGMVLWESAINVPHDEFKAPPALATALDEALIFRPLPFVKRVIFVASPHRGSPLANDLIGRVVSSLVQSPDDLTKHIAEIEELNGPRVISPELRGRLLNAVGNLRTDSPILTALDRIPIDPGIPYHSIIPMIGGTRGTDGVVEYRSSHLKGALSEQIVSGTHFSQSKPEVTLELRRILLEHLAAPDPPVTVDRGSRFSPRPPTLSATSESDVRAPRPTVLR